MTNFYEVGIITSVLQLKIKLRQYNLEPQKYQN